MQVIRPQHTHKRSCTVITQIHNPILFKRHRLTIKVEEEIYSHSEKNLCVIGGGLYVENNPQFSDPKSSLMCMDVEPDVHSRLDVPQCCP